MRVYRVLRAFLALLVQVFFRQVDVVDRELHVPAEGEGAVIFVGNHPNSLLDPALIIACCGRVVHFAAKDTLFKSPLLRFVFTRLGAVPIARRDDHGGGAAVDNDSAFEALFEVLARGRAMGIFPEGLSHDEAQLARLKTGAARIALGLAARHPELRLRVVPCGLSYVHRKRFRSRVLVQFGPPIEVGDDWRGARERDEREAARALTAEIEAGLRALTINAPDWETLRVLDGVRRLYQPTDVSLGQRAELARRFAAVYATVRHEPEVAELFARVARYLDRLRAAGLADRDLRRRARPGEAAGRLARHLVLMFVWLPLALPGAPLFLALGLAVRFLSPHLTPRKDVLATTKLVMGLLGCAAAFAAVPLAVAARAGAGAGLGTAALMLASGYATLRVVERGSALREVFATFVRLLFFRAEVDALRAERAALEAAVVAAVDRYRPADMVPIFGGRGASGGAPAAPGVAP